MSDEIFEVPTHSVDVAALGQDYSDRVDGERILLGLPRALEEGDEVRFVVLLLDGTPAFAGAGRCVQVSDQGSDAGALRFETLIDSLAFDERSQPVYEYIVAVRQLAYQQGENAEGAEESVEVNAAEEVDVAVGQEQSPWNDAEATRIARGSIPPEAHGDLAAEAQGDRTTPHQINPSSLPTPLPTDLPEPREPDALSAAGQFGGVTAPAYSTIPPEPLKTGILTRPALAAHWAPAAPRPPQRSLRPSSFQSHPGPLAVPDVPPRPKLDRSQWVERAPAPQ